KLRGVWCAATASGRNQDLLRELGADLPVNYETTPFEDVVSGVDAVVESMGGQIRARSWKTLRKGGAMVAVIGPAPSEEEAARHVVRAVIMWAQMVRADLDEIGQAMVEGKVKPVIQSVLPLSQAREAHEQSQTGHARGKIVVTV